MDKTQVQQEIEGMGAPFGYQGKEYLAIEWGKLDKFKEALLPKPGQEGG